MLAQLKNQISQGIRLKSTGLKSSHFKSTGFKTKALAAIFAAGLLVGCANNAMQSDAALQVDIFNPQEASMFPVSSSFISGEGEVLLVDAQFQRNDAQTLVDKIKASGKTLKTVYVSHYDPDFYFGLDLIVDNFPNVKIYTTPSTLKKMKVMAGRKLAYWGPILKENAPERLVMPDVLKGDMLTVDGQTVKIIGLEGHDPSHTFLWIPSSKTVTGGVPLYDNMHAWMADNQTPESRQSWLKTLDMIEALKPEKIIPGHYLGKSTMDLGTVERTRAYIKAFEKQAAQATDSKDLIARMKALYPTYKGVDGLALSAKVIMGEMKWPQ